MSARGTLSCGGDIPPVPTTYIDFSVRRANELRDALEILEDIAARAVERDERRYNAALAAHASIDADLHALRRILATRCAPWFEAQS